MDAGASLMAALDKLVLVRREGGFALGDRPPAWFYRLGFEPAPVDQPVEIERLLPFLEAFLPEVEKAWAEEGSGHVDSCIWTEVAPGGEEVHLEATALRVGAERLLVITRNDALFFEQRRVLQRARELRIAHAALSREVERRDVLVHCIVHDLAAPLNSTLGALSVLDERPLGERDAELVRVAMKAALRQRELIRTILDTFAAEQRAIDVACDNPAAAPDLRAVITQVVEAHTPMASSRGVRLSAPPGARCDVIGDERRLARVLWNLVDNAIRYTPAGRSVRVLVDEEPSHDGAASGPKPRAPSEPDAVRLAVEDEGPGVPPAVAAHLFQKFARGRDPAAGTGLGLYFCRITVESWGGAIGYEARPEGGSRFWVRLRRAVTAAERRSAAPGDERKGGATDGEAPGRRRR